MAAGRVEGVTLSGAEQEGEHLGADFVVDCTGKSTPYRRLAGGRRLRRAAQRKVNVGLGYASRFYARAPDERLGGARGVISLTDDIHRARRAVAFPVEGGRWLVTVGGYDLDRPTWDPADYASRLDADPCIALRRSRDDMVSEVTTYRYPVSIRRDFHRCGNLPGGLVGAGIRSPRLTRSTARE